MVEIAGYTVLVALIIFGWTLIIGHILKFWATKVAEGYWSVKQHIHDATTVNLNITKEKDDGRD